MLTGGSYHPDNRPGLSHLALQGISLFGLLDLDVVGHDGVVVQLGAILQVAGEGLGLFGVAQVDHVQGEAELRLALLGAPLVLNLQWSRVKRNDRFLISHTCCSCKSVKRFKKLFFNACKSKRRPPAYVAVYLGSLQMVQSPGVAHVDPRCPLLVIPVGLFVFYLKHTRMPAITFYLSHFFHQFHLHCFPWQMTT